MHYIFWILWGYLAGSVPVGLIIARVLRLGDLRAIGSGNIGSTNVLRTGNKTAAALTLCGDFLKGFLPVWFYLRYGGVSEGYFAGSTLAAWIAMFAVLGHIFPIWLRFKGGKGVATTLGVYMALSPICSVVAIILWLGIFTSSRISSLSALLSLCGSLPIVTAILVWYTDQPLSLLFFSVLNAALLAWTHRANVKRLLAGTEPAFRKSAK